MALEKWPGAAWSGRLATAVRTGTVATQRAEVDIQRRVVRLGWDAEYVGGALAEAADAVGQAGRDVGQILTPFECEVLRVARTARSAPLGPVQALADLPDLLPRADAVNLATPLTDATIHLVDAAFLARMWNGSLLVNIARGRVVDTEALLTEPKLDGCVPR